MKGSEIEPGYGVLVGTFSFGVEIVCIALVWVVWDEGRPDIHHAWLIGMHRVAVVLLDARDPARCSIGIKSDRRPDCGYPLWIASTSSTHSLQSTITLFASATVPSLSILLLAACPAQTESDIARIIKAMFTAVNFKSDCALTHLSLARPRMRPTQLLPTRFAGMLQASEWK